VKYGIHLSGAWATTPEDLTRVARAAEDLRYDAILSGDHVLVPKQISSPWPSTRYFGGDHAPLARAANVAELLDSFNVLSFLAGATTSTRLIMSLLVVPYRNPIDVARRVTTLDVLSAGRAVVGAGIGWVEEEFRLLGVPFEERAARTSEYLSVMKALWTQAEPSFHGNYIRIDQPVEMLPRPVQLPHPPIWIGGESTPALRRVVQFGDGYHMSHLTTEQIRILLGRLEPLMEDSGRHLADLELSAMADMDRVDPQALEEYEELGISLLHARPIGNSLEERLESMKRFADTVGGW
jgi:probable F420-dependent oxidoreductase